MKIVLTQVKGKDLKAGDLFVQAEQEEIDEMVRNHMGLSVFVRTDMPYRSSVYDSLDMSKIKIVKNKLF